MLPCLARSRHWTGHRRHGAQHVPRCPAGGCTAVTPRPPPSRRGC